MSLAHADLWPEEAAPGTACGLFLILPSLSLSLLGPLLPPGLGPSNRSPIPTQRRLLSAPPMALARGPAGLIQRAQGFWALGSPGQVTGAPWSSPLEQVTGKVTGKMAHSEPPCLLQCPCDPGETHTLATPTVAAPSALTSLSSYFSSAQIGREGK